MFIGWRFGYIFVFLLFFHHFFPSKKEQQQNIFSFFFNVNEFYRNRYSERIHNFIHVFSLVFVVCPFCSSSDFISIKLIMNYTWYKQRRMVKMFLNLMNFSNKLNSKWHEKKSITLLMVGHEKFNLSLILEQVKKIIETALLFLKKKNTSLNKIRNFWGKLWRLLLKIFLKIFIFSLTKLFPSYFNNH